MAILKFRYAQKEFIELSDAGVDFIREVSDSKNITITYTNGTGQQLTSGQVLYTTTPTITAGQDGYLHVTVSGNHTLTGSGSFIATVAAHPSPTQVANSISYTIDGSTGNINLYYNSVPQAEDVVIDKGNREVHIFSMSDFDYSDYDGDVVDKVAVHGSVDGYELNGAQYVAGTYVSSAEMAAGLFIYTPLDQDAYYEKDNTYSVMDINGNVST